MRRNDGREERRGEERRGEERRGEERKGEERRGKERGGGERKGEGRENTMSPGAISTVPKTSSIMVRSTNWVG